MSNEVLVTFFILCLGIIAAASFQYSDAPFEVPQELFP